jgi:hypothetical protein
VSSEPIYGRKMFDAFQGIYFCCFVGTIVVIFVIFIDVVDVVSLLLAQSSIT